MSDKTVIEINGVKLEVDLRHATRIDELRVGDRVKVLVKKYSDYGVHAGVVIGFEPFDKLPTIIICYVETSYSEAELKFLYFNAETKETEVIKAIDDDQLDLEKAKVVEKIEKKMLEHEGEIEKLRNQRDYFLRQFRAYWEPVHESNGTPAADGEQ